MPRRDSSWPRLRSQIWPASSSRVRSSTATGRPTRSTPRAGRAELYGDAIFLVGADEFCDFLSWREPDEILDAVRLGVASRPGFPRERLDAVLGGLRRPDRVELFEIEPLPIESRELRVLAGRGESLTAFVPPAVARLVAERGLYRD